MTDRIPKEATCLRNDAALSVALRTHVHRAGASRVCECLAVSAGVLQDCTSESDADTDDDVPEETEEEEPMDVCDDDIQVEGEAHDESICIHPVADTFGKEGGAGDWTGWIASLEAGKMFDLEKLRPGELLGWPIRIPSKLLPQHQISSHCVFAKINNK